MNMKITKEFKIGVVITASIGIFIWGFNFLKGKDLFSRKFELYAVYPKIDGLIEANPMLVNGFKIGQINEISLFKQSKHNNNISSLFCALNKV